MRAREDQPGGVIVTSRVVERCRPYNVRMACGHIERRMMREDTAGMPWSESAIVQAGAPCMACWAKLSTPAGDVRR